MLKTITRKLSTQRLLNNSNFLYNLSYVEIAKQERLRKEGLRLKNNVFQIDTSPFTGRSPNDKYFVDTSHDIHWGKINKPISQEIFDRLKEKCILHYNKKKDSYFVFDGYCGANKTTQKRVRFITEYAWQHHFVKNMFRPSYERYEDFVPDFTILNACNVTNSEWKQDGLYSENFIMFDVANQLGIIGGTSYGGEMKKGIFTLMNYWLPRKGILPMHCSANINGKGDTTLFFGLSGTGKTTLSTDETTNLIGDDEHGWDDDGIFNFEGGCYAKTNGLDPTSEPTIYHAIRENALLENVTVIENEPDYHDTEKTENGRVSYPLSHIPNHVPEGKGNHPKNIIFLTCDRFGVLPFVSRLNATNAKHYFLMGYTSKMGGTERGVMNPSVTFSPCFGSAFLPLHPTVYADLLAEKIQTHQCNVYLLNTGWKGTGQRYNIGDTREIVYKIMDGSLQDLPMANDVLFGLSYPEKYNAYQYWNKIEKYISKRNQLKAEMNNFMQSFKN